MTKIQDMASLAVIGVAGFVLGRAQGNGLPTATAEMESGALVADWRSYQAAGHVLGTPDAEVTITVFSDYQCPFCRALSFALDSLLTAGDAESVRIIYRHHVLRQHPQARRAALAAECAGDQGRFAEYHRSLFREQAALPEEPWLRLAGEVGVPDLDRFEACLEKEQFAWRLAEDGESGAALGVRGTPTFLVNQRLAVGTRSFSQIVSIVRDVRAGSGTLD